MTLETNLHSVLSQILLGHKNTDNKHPLLVGISGIDASGKGFITNKLAEHLRDKGLNVANIGVDPWQNLPEVRMPVPPLGEQFFHNAIRFEALFEQLILPLKQSGSVNVAMDYMEQTASEFRTHTYSYSDVDIILLEGIFLFQPQWLPLFDMTVWVECSEATALKRALSRNQEGLEDADLIQEYQTIYFPAQRFHKVQNAPIETADYVFNND